MDNFAGKFFRSPPILGPLLDLNTFRRDEQRLREVLHAQAFALMRCGEATAEGRAS